MKKVIPKKKDAFLEKDNSIEQKRAFPDPDLSDYPLLTKKEKQERKERNSSMEDVTGDFIGVAGSNIHTGDMVMVREDGRIVPFTGSEGRNGV